MTGWVRDTGRVADSGGAGVTGGGTVAVTVSVIGIRPATGVVKGEVCAAGTVAVAAASGVGAAVITTSTVSGSTPCARMPVGTTTRGVTT